MIAFGSGDISIHWGQDMRIKFWIIIFTAIVWFQATHCMKRSNRVCFVQNRSRKSSPIDADLMEKSKFYLRNRYGAGAGTKKLTLNNLPLLLEPKPKKKPKRRRKKRKHSFCELCRESEKKEKFNKKLNKKFKSVGSQTNLSEPFEVKINATEKVYLQDLDYQLDAFGELISIRGVSMVFDIRNFTFFSNSNKSKIAAKFIKKLNKVLSLIVSKWDGIIVSKPGDGFVALFPKEKNKKYKEIFIKAFLCSIEIICQFHENNKIITNEIEHEEEIIVKNYPHMCGIGLEKGIVNISIDDNQDSLTPVVAIGKSINNAQRYESHSKEIKRNWAEYAPIIISKLSYEYFNYKTGDLSYLHIGKSLKNIFLKKYGHIAEKKPLARRPSLKGMLKKIIIYGASFDNVKNFYKNNRSLFNNKSPQLFLNINDLHSTLIGTE